MTATTRSSGEFRERGARTAPRRVFTEAKNGFMTSEFYAMLLVVAGLLAATYLPDDDDALTIAEGWRYVAWVAAAYIVSRGLAKMGVGVPRTDRDDD